MLSGTVDSDSLTAGDRVRLVGGVCLQGMAQCGLTLQSLEPLISLNLDHMEPYVLSIRCAWIATSSTSTTPCEAEHALCSIQRYVPPILGAKPHCPSFVFAIET